jgi:hypothetical protein
VAQSHGVPGTWFVSLPGGLTGFYTYNQDGTMTGVASTIFGAQPQPPGPLNTSATDHGVWRQAGDRVEVVAFRMSFDGTTGDPVLIFRIRAFFTFDPGRDSTSGEFTGDIWFCPDALSCPDPNTTPPDLVDVALPPPLNTWTQTRVRMPRPVL